MFFYGRGIRGYVAQELLQVALAVRTRKYPTICVHRDEGIRVYLGEGFVHVPCYDSDFEEAMVQWGCLWVGSR